MAENYLFLLKVLEKNRDHIGCTKMVHLGYFGYHGKLLVVFGFLFFVFCVSSFVGRYSTSGLECPQISKANKYTLVHSVCVTHGQTPILNLWPCGHAGT